MKTNALFAFFFFFFFFFFFLFAFTIAEYVYDSAGEPLRNAGKYYLAPAAAGAGVIAGVKIGDDEACSLAVAQRWDTTAWPVYIGTPIEVLYINTTSFLRIAFADLPTNPCTQKPNWVVTSTLGFGVPVMVGSDEEYPLTVSGWFYLKPYNAEKHYYKLIFCHKEDECGNVGVKTDSHKNHRLVITDESPLVFKLVKVKESVVASVLSMVE